MRTTLLLALTLFATSPLVRSQSAFSDTFEGPSLAPFWTPYVDDGQVIAPSSSMVHAGASALELVTLEATGPAKAAGVRHVFSEPTYGELSVWLYDTGADMESSNYLTLWAPPFGIGTFDYDLGPGLGSSYEFTVGDVGYTSSVDRTQAWHHLVIRSTPDSSSLEIDGIQVYVGTGGMPFSDVQLDMHAPSWRPDWNCYFDDFEFIPHAWTDLGFGLAGSLGTPTLKGTGNLTAGSTGTLRLSGAVPLAPAVLFVATEQSPSPFKGGALVPVPPLAILPLITMPIGDTSIAWTDWPAGPYAGLSFYLQYAIVDAGAVQGIALSNALQADLP